MRKILLEFNPSFYKAIVKGLDKKDYKRLSIDTLLVRNSKGKNLLALSNNAFKINKEILGISMDDIVKELSKLLKRKESFLLKCIIKGNKIFNTRTLKFNSRDVEVKVGTILESKGYIVNKKTPNKIVYIHIIDNNTFLSILKKDMVRSINRTELKDALNRSQLKLREALEYFKIDINKIKKALDLGASPGGFSRELSKYGVKVTSIDPSAMDESLKNDKNIIHLRIRAEDFNTNEKFDLLLNDMNLHPNESCELLLKLSKFLKKSGICIMTVKCPTKNVYKYLDDTISLLEGNFKNFEFKHLPHNRQEITVMCKKR